jgi:hypothetical protein
MTQVIDSSSRMRDHGQGQAEDPGARLHVLGHAADQDRNHDDVIDTQDDLEGGQGEEGNPDFRVGQPFHVYSFERVLNRASSSAARW